jgi:flavin reductase (DIM6/NTAB) family NADH-FMN oxidoreductase RutF
MLCQSRVPRDRHQYGGIVGFFVLEVVQAWIDPAVKKPRTIHHLGLGKFLAAGETISLKSKMK